MREVLCLNLNMFSIITRSVLYKEHHYAKYKVSSLNHENRNKSACKVKLGSRQERGGHVQSTIFILKR